MVRLKYAQLVDFVHDVLTKLPLSYSARQKRRSRYVVGQDHLDQPPG